VPRVPVVDISNPSSTDLGAIDSACRDHGFFLVAGHGLDEIIAETWTQTTRFFDASRTLRKSVERSLENPLGYFDRELTKRERDHKEVFDFIDPSIERLDARNRWPEDLEGFRSTLNRYFDAFSDLTSRTLDLVHRALDLSAESRALTSFDRNSSTVRLNHYTLGDPVPENERDGLAVLGKTALGYHTDPGAITLLLQDDTGGLQAESLDDGWIDVPPTAGTVVVNLGDCMQAWTNDRYRAAVHRVLPMTTKRRFSIPYFANPHRDAMVAPLPELSIGGAQYREFAWRDHMAARAYDNFSDLGKPDTQLSDYRI